MVFDLQFQQERGQQDATARSASDSITTCSSSAWAPPPRATEAVERRDADRRGEVAVAAAAGRTLGQLQAELPTDPPGLLEEGGDRRAIAPSAAG